MASRRLLQKIYLFVTIRLTHASSHHMPAGFTDELNMAKSHASVIPYKRAGRWLLWPRPFWYRPFGIVRRQMDCMNRQFDLWIDGFPRSANTFCVHAFQSANPKAKVRSHRHLPPFIIQAVAYGKPGIFLVRKPVDAALSWAIYRQEELGICLEYYIDFHRALRPHIPSLFTASFEQVTTHFDRVVERFNRRFGASYQTPDMTGDAVQRCFARVEKAWTLPGNEPDENTVPRPSPQRARVKAQLLEELQANRGLMRKLDAANELYLEFRSETRRGANFSNFSTSQVPTLS